MGASAAGGGPAREGPAGGEPGPGEEAPGGASAELNEYGMPARPGCTFCDGTNTELHSPFGTALTVATYWCRDCRTSFEYVKWNER